MSQNQKQVSFSIFRRHGLVLSETVMIDGLPFATRKAIGLSLDYADPQKSIDTLISRFPFIDDYSITLDLVADNGQRYRTKLYHPLGQLVIFTKSAQPIAQERQIQMVNVVWDQMKGKYLPEWVKREYRLMLADAQKELKAPVSEFHRQFFQSVVSEMKTLLSDSDLLVSQQIH